jgi:anti-sigma regulatory factor (Ser/Thr protein kinase)
MTTENPLSTPPIEAEFGMRFTSTPRGARLARRLVARRLDAWGHPYGSSTHDDVTLIAAELAANAVRHGRGPGGEFALRLAAAPTGFRVEVTDARGERLPNSGESASLDAESGRGLWLVSQLADRWGVEPVPPDRSGAGKTVWAEVAAVAAVGTARAGRKGLPS